MTKITNISYRGIKHTPSNLSDKDGSALECVNLTQDGTDLKPMPMPAIQYDEDGNLIHFSKNTTLVAVHEVTGERHYILTSPNANGKPVTLYFKDQDNLDVYTQASWTNGSEIYAVESIGNTLVVSTANGIEYFYWKNGAYVYLGQKPPMPVLQFKLNNTYDPRTGIERLHVEKEEAENIIVGEEDVVLNHDLLPDLNLLEKDVEGVEQIIKGLISKLDLKIAKDGSFNSPFFIRYALRMKDGNYIRHSEPILIVTSSEKCPLQCSFETDSSYKLTKIIVYSILSKIKMKLCYFEGGLNFSDWSDVVKSIDIFISDQIKSYSNDDIRGNEIRPFQPRPGEAINAIRIITHPELDCGFSLFDSGKFDIKDMYSTSHCYLIKSKDEKEFFGTLKENSTFYKAASFSIEELMEYENIFKYVDFGDLSAINNHVVLPDDYMSHFSVSANIMQTYNSRLNIANIRNKAYIGFPAKMNLQPTSPSEPNAYAIYYHLKKNGESFVVGGNSDGGYLNYATYIYYPDADCYKITVAFLYNSATILLECLMKEHESLNGSYWFDNLNTLSEFITAHQSEWKSASEMPELSEGWYSLPNRFAMSAVGNPWYFPVANMFDIGKREIRSLSINAEELSYAQYGQNPILVLASDGTWSLGIQGDGSPKGVSYISSDVISKMETLTDTPSVTANQATFFVTDRGLMMASGSKVMEVGRDMHGAIFDCKNELLPQNSVLPTPIHIAFNEIINKVTDNIPFADYIKGANLAWDYKHNRLLVINKAHPYVYVYDLSYDFWSKMLITDTMLPIEEGYQHNTKSNVKFTQCVNNGTELFMQDNNGYLYDIKGDIDENDIDELQYGFYVSRPMRFGADTFKTIVRLKHRFTKKANGENVKMMLYGSRDGNTFYRISTMRGSSYMYFIVVLYTTMLPAQRYAYTSFEFEDRLTNKLR